MPSQTPSHARPERVSGGRPKYCCRFVFNLVRKGLCPMSYVLCPMIGYWVLGPAYWALLRSSQHPTPSTRPSTRPSNFELRTSNFPRPALNPEEGLFCFRWLWGRQRDSPVCTIMDIQGREVPWHVVPAVVRQLPRHRHHHPPPGGPDAHPPCGAPPVARITPTESGSWSTTDRSVRIAARQRRPT